MPCVAAPSENSPQTPCRCCAAAGDQRASTRARSEQALEAFAAEQVRAVASRWLLEDDIDYDPDQFAMDLVQVRAAMTPSREEIARVIDEMIAFAAEGPSD